MKNFKLVMLFIVVCGTVNAMQKTSGSQSPSKTAARKKAVELKKAMSKLQDDFLPATKGNLKKFFDGIGQDSRIFNEMGKSSKKNKI